MVEEDFFCVSSVVFSVRAGEALYKRIPSMCVYIRPVDQIEAMANATEDSTTTCFFQIIFLAAES